MSIQAAGFQVGDKVKGISGDIVGCEGIIVAIDGKPAYPEDIVFSIELTLLGNKDWHTGNSYRAAKDEWHIGAVTKRRWYRCIEIIEPIESVEEIESAFYQWLSAR